MDDVLKYTSEAMESWENKRCWKKPRKWLECFSTRVTYYGKILDVIAQHHPEYVSLAWGTMKLLFVIVINHETSVKQVAKTLVRIAESLSQVVPLLHLYPNGEMINAVASLYAHMISFLQRATIWYRGSSTSRLFKAIFSPFELSFGELLVEIREHGEHVAKLADVGHKQETREIKELLYENVKRPGVGIDTGQELDARRGMQGQAYYTQMMPDGFFSICGMTLSVFAKGKLEEPPLWLTLLILFVRHKRAAKIDFCLANGIRKSFAELCSDS
ncbi:unnamed protein product [Tuber melanosporum]|uniref:(Perigord truffle) hypothetical protein n=1 Tax=Tuber melanosporum (strain Mel28) TaxID=656061 RepID=D5GGN2_TUBMM|nr:uncharacterized protein GSTUM_00007433001 [Tuber melanosporum]CAZ83654.1 unnamed protein product [Tuber melanosporum]